jgi:hypothetical protein
MLCRPGRKWFDTVHVRTESAACRIGLNRRIARSRKRVGWCESSTRLFSAARDDGKHQASFLFRHRVARELIGHDGTGDMPMVFEQLPEEALRRRECYRPNRLCSFAAPNEVPGPFPLTPPGESSTRSGEFPGATAVNVS